MAKVTSTDIKEATKEEFLAIQEVSKMDIKKGLKNKSVSTELKKEIEQLEVKAKQNVVEDIKSESKEMAAKMEKLGNADAEKLNAEVVFGLYKRAPVEKKPSKLEEEDLSVSDDQIYQKYFEK